MKETAAEEPGVQFKATEWLALAAPVPLKLMTKGELEALLVTVAVPERVPALAGSKTTLNEADWFAASVRGRLTPDEENPEPLTAIAETVTPALPVFVSVTVCVLLVLSVVLPKVTDVGEAESWRTEATLVPAKATTMGEVGELFMSERFA